ncbi:hypothetical protein JCM16418A_42050 [Paenibacillus pini]|uniref:Uncharacterized protein n=1 Tax=Paenibacillus pini JCM 16418 TaxID=1236976 RepID=W7YR08_9BACL|nr:hypothetical protein JCM16418_4023 [Paenibacillus pini JCM 16418]
MKIILSIFEEFEVTATVVNGSEAVEYCKANEVGETLLDVRLTNMNGVSLKVVGLLRLTASFLCIEPMGQVYLLGR